VLLSGLVTRSAVQSRKWQLIGMSYYYYNYYYYYYYYYYNYYYCSVEY